MSGSSRWRPQIRSPRRALAAALAWAGLAGYVLLVYVAVVLGGGALIGHTASPDLALSVLATAVVALSFERVGRALTRQAYAALHAGGATTYDLLAGFSRTVAGRVRPGDVPVQMARLLGEGTAASWVQVWIVAPGDLSLAAVWPQSDHEPRTSSDVGTLEAEARSTAGRRHHRVHQGSELMGLIVLQEREGIPLTATEERLLAGLADHAGVVLRGQRLRGELEARREELALRERELLTSRQRIVRAQDAERQRLERDIHDGAQQHLVALAVKLRHAHQTAGTSPARAAEMLHTLERAIEETIATLVGLARGLYPPELGEQGLTAALRAAVGAGDPRVTLTAESVGRLPTDLEAAAYFCCVEAVQNATKHAPEAQVRISLRQDVDRLTCIVEDDGPGIPREPTTGGRGLANMRDRIEAVGGRLDIAAGPAGGARLEAHLPLVTEGRS